MTQKIEQNIGEVSLKNNEESYSDLGSGFVGL